MKFLDKIKLLSDSGPAGPNDWRKIADEPEMQDYSDGRGRPSGLMEDPSVEHGFPFKGKSTPSLPDVKSKGGKEGAFIKKIQAKSNRIFFPDLLRIVKTLFPEMKLTKAKPPTYVWNPKGPNTPGPESERQGKDEEDVKPGEEEPTAPEIPEEESPLDVKKLKDRLALKLPQLIWTSRSVDGAETSTYEFPDTSTVEFLIGASANHLTLIYHVGEPS